jgi:two-component system response regulator NreC
MRILIADDNESVRRGVIRILAARPSSEICGMAKDGAEAVQKARELSPDLILMDVSMPGLNGLDAAREIRQGRSRAKILMLSQHDPAQLLPRAIQAGAQACVDKSRLGADLLPAIEKVA